jgi:hypothetical protein
MLQLLLLANLLQIAMSLSLAQAIKAPDEVIMHVFDSDTVHN